MSLRSLIEDVVRDMFPEVAREVRNAVQPGGRVPAGLLSGTIPTAVAHVHATTHQPGGTDGMAVDAAASTGSLRTLGTGAQQAAAGTHAHAGAGHVIQDEGTSLTQRGNLNFVGAGVAVTDDAANNRSVVTISGAAGSVISPADNITLWQLCR